MIVDKITRSYIFIYYFSTFCGYVWQFDEVIDHEGNPIEDLRKLVDPRLGGNYSIDSIHEVLVIVKCILLSFTLTRDMIK